MGNKKVNSKTSESVWNSSHRKWSTFSIWRLVREIFFNHFKCALWWSFFVLRVSSIVIIVRRKINLHKCVDRQWFRTIRGKFLIDTRVVAIFEREKQKAKIRWQKRSKLYRKCDVKGIKMNEAKKSISVWFFLFFSTSIIERLFKLIQLNSLFTWKLSAMMWWGGEVRWVECWGKR